MEVLTQGSAFHETDLIDKAGKIDDAAKFGARRARDSSGLGHRLNEAADRDRGE